MKRSRALDLIRSCRVSSIEVDDRINDDNDPPKKQSQRRVSSFRKDQEGEEDTRTPQEFFETEPYFDGLGDLRVGCDDISAQLILLEKGIIECFIVDWMDYFDIHMFDEVLDRLKSYSLDKCWNNMLSLYPTKHGILVTTNGKWIKDSLCIEIRQNINDYQVSLIDVQTMNDILAPPSILDDLPVSKKPDTTIRGNRFTVYITFNDHRSIIIKKFSEEMSSYARKYAKLLSAHLPSSYTVSIYDEKAKKCTMGTICDKEYDIQETINPEIDINDYIDTISDEWKTLNKNERILKLVRSKC